jgi:hypothetical protein
MGTNTDEPRTMRRSLWGYTTGNKQTVSRRRGQQKRRGLNKLRLRLEKENMRRPNVH